VPFAPPSSDESAPADKMFGSMTPKDWKEMNEDAKEFSEDFKNTEADGLDDIPASGESYEQGQFSSLLAVMSLKDEAFLELLDKAPYSEGPGSESQKLWSARANYFAHLAVDLNEDTIKSILQREELRFLQGKYQKWQEVLNWSYLQYVAASRKLGKHSFVVSGDHELAHTLLLYQVPHRLSEIVDYELFAGVFTMTPVTSSHSSSANHADSMRDLASRIDASGGRVRSWYEYAAWASKQLNNEVIVARRRDEALSSFYLPVLHHLASLIEGRVSLIEEAFIEKRSQSPSFEQFRELVVSADNWEEYYNALDASPYVGVDPFDKQFGSVDRNANLLEATVMVSAWDFFEMTGQDLKLLYWSEDSVFPLEVEDGLNASEVDLSDRNFSALSALKDRKLSVVSRLQTGVLRKQLDGVDIWNAIAERDKVFNHFEAFSKWYVESYQKEAHLRNYRRDLVSRFYGDSQFRYMLIDSMKKKYNLKRKRIKKDISTLILLLQAWFDAKALD
ncbi:MAG: hypothetical protein OXC44_04900, partial [Proteobacteria bacterium]|nr:hypothetical protein [Pseudomonadota bacterium]